MCVGTASPAEHLGEERALRAADTPCLHGACAGQRSRLPASYPRHDCAVDTARTLRGAHGARELQRVPGRVCGACGSCAGEDALHAVRAVVEGDY